MEKKGKAVWLMLILKSIEQIPTFKPGVKLQLSALLRAWMAVAAKAAGVLALVVFELSPHFIMPATLRILVGGVLRAAFTNILVDALMLAVPVLPLHEGVLKFLQHCVVVRIVLRQHPGKVYLIGCIGSRLPAKSSEQELMDYVGSLRLL
jgi:hypothetical protein